MFKKLFLTSALLFAITTNVFATGDVVGNIPIKKLDELSATPTDSTDFFVVYDASADKDKKIDAARIVFEAATNTWAGVQTFSLGYLSTAISLTPDDSDGAGVNMITAGITAVDVGAVVNGVTDYIVLPVITTVPVGHTITIVCNAGGAFELRTPATSAEEINSEDCDGTKEYLCTDGNIIKVIKISDTIDWMAHEFTPIGAVVTAVVPD